MSAIAEPIVTLSEAQAFVRVETGEEEALLAGLIRSASALCEAFIGQVVVAREIVERVPASGNWERLAACPIASITAVEGIASDGSLAPLAAETYATDIDSSGTGWVRAGPTTDIRVVKVTASAGLAADRNGVPEPIRQGVLRLVAHMFATRDGAGGEPPAAVSALWRPYRRMRLA